MRRTVKILVLLGLIAAIPLFWMNLDTLGIDPSMRFYVVGGGISLTLLGVLYKLLGSFDLIPDWIPLLGGLDDKFAWLAMFVGLGVAGFGWHFL